MYAAAESFHARQRLIVVHIKIVLLPSQDMGNTLTAAPRVKLQTVLG